LPQKGEVWLDKLWSAFVQYVDDIRGLDDDAANPDGALDVSLIVGQNIVDRPEDSSPCSFRHCSASRNLAMAGSLSIRASQWK
jgi:hypothetical protein